MMPTLAMFSDNRIIGLQHHLDDKLTFTSIRDIANVVAAAVDYEGEWPEIGGISGDEVSLRQVQEIGETLKGMLSGITSFLSHNLTNDQGPSSELTLSTNLT